MIRLLFCAIFAAPCFAQAWLPPKGEGSLSVSYQDLFFDGHYISDGTKMPVFQSRSKNFIGDINYGLTDRIAVGLQFPVVFAKYTGAEAPLNPSTVDDRRYHGTFQDLRFEVRGNLFKKPFALTPFFAFVVPSHDYEVVGEAAPGRGVKEYRTGISAGRLLNPFLNGGYVHGTYTYTFVERILDIPLNRSDLELEFGYFATSRLSVRVLGSLLRTHGGLTIDEVFGGPVDPHIFLNHDRFLSAKYQHLGGGVSFALRPSVDVHADLVKFVSGKDSHYGKGVSAGVTWTFSTRRDIAHHARDTWKMGMAVLLKRR